jgi:hypothetical protein
VKADAPVAQKIVASDDRSRPRILLTERDRRMLAFAAEHRFVVDTQVAALVQCSVRAAGERLRELAADGYLEMGRTWDAQPAWFQVTRPGLRGAGSDLSRPRPIDPGTYAHDLGVGWLMVAAERGRFGALADIVSERRMRSHDGRRDRSGRYGVRLGGPGPRGRERLHYPDLVVVTATGHRIALELERTPKGARRRDEILGAYGADRRIDAVVYLCDTPSVGRSISAAARRLGLSDRITVGPVDWGRSPPPMGAAGRRPERAPRPRSGGHRSAGITAER